MCASVVVGEDEKNGGLWCSPRAKTSSPTSSAFCAIATTALIRSASVGVRPFVGSVVMSLTEKIPNCISSSKVDDVSCAFYKVHDASSIPGGRSPSMRRSAGGAPVAIPGLEPHRRQRRRRQRVGAAAGDLAEPPSGHPILPGLDDLLVGAADEVPPHHQVLLERL